MAGWFVGGVGAALLSRRRRSHRRRDVARGLPGELDSGFVIGVCPLNLRISSLNHIAVVIVPAALSLRLVVVEGALEVRSVVV